MKRQPPDNQDGHSLDKNNHTKPLPLRDFVDPRIKPTEPERLLWNKIRNKNLGVSFRRHHVIGSYTADFYCAECALIIELQDNIRFTPTAQAQQDQRDTFLQNLGLTLLRFSNEQILKNIDTTLEKINRAIENNKKN